MYVCHCVLVTDREIHAAVECGARDECAIARLCGAGSRCGGCLPFIRDLLAERGIDIDEPVTSREVRQALRAFGHVHQRHVRSRRCKVTSGSSTSSTNT
ncbi:MAG: (2Fe-2S)-binding protein [Actinobacteria bacterium]|nr:(2Fe-2S)-binding protein [Actinomycetota bacterium]